MLLSLFLGASAGASYVISTYPCQRLGWAWRNVWVTCSIDARVPGDYIMPTGAIPTFANAPNFNEGFKSYGSSPYNAPTLDLQLTAGNVPTQWALTPTTMWTNSQKAKQFCAAVGGAPSIADANLHMLGIRTACRRAVDLYGSLLELCRNPVRARIPLIAPGIDAAPNAKQLVIGTKQAWTFAGAPTLNAANFASHLVPHFANGQTLQYLQHECIAPGQDQLVAANSCPGILGWWTVVYQACNIANTNPFRQAGGNSEGHYSPRAQAIVMNPPSYGVNAAWDALQTPSAFCSNAKTNAPDGFNPSGPSFKGSACRRALDQFARTAHRCQPINAGLIPSQKALKNLGLFFGTWAPTCDSGTI